jgi:thiol-disulfide isomerase/thioredoxin
MIETKTRRAWRYLGSGVLIWIGVVLLAFAAGEVLKGDPRPAAPRVNSQSPDFTLNNLSGEQIRLSERHGKPVIVNFWATWCGPCVLEMPNLEKYYEKYPGQFDILAVNADEEKYRVESFVKDMRITFNILLDPGGAIEARYQVSAYPTSFILDKEGIIRIQHIGLLDEKHLAEYLAQVGVGP